jgi:hypothetical protein
MGIVKESTDIVGNLRRVIEIKGGLGERLKNAECPGGIVRVEGIDGVFPGTLNASCIRASQICCSPDAPSFYC